MKVVWWIGRGLVLCAALIALLHAVNAMVVPHKFMHERLDEVWMVALVIVNLLVTVLLAVLAVKAFDKPGVPALCGTIAALSVYIQLQHYFTLDTSSVEYVFLWTFPQTAWLYPLLGITIVAFLLSSAVSLGEKRRRTGPLLLVWLTLLPIGFLLAAARNKGLTLVYNAAASAISGHEVNAPQASPIHVSIGGTLLDPVTLGAAFLSAIWVLILCTSGLVAFGLFERRYADADTEEDKHRIAWVGSAALAGALTTGALIIVAAFLPGWPFWPLSVMRWTMNLPMFVLYGCLVGFSILTLGVFAGGAIDSKLVIRRTAVYGFATFAGIFVFAGVENLLVNRLADLLSLPTGIATWISGGTAAVAIGYARKAASERIKGAKPWVSAKSSAAEESSLQPE